MMTLIDLSRLARQIAERLLEDKFGHEQKKYVVAEVVFGSRCTTIEFDAFSDCQKEFDAETGKLSENWRLCRIGVIAEINGNDWEIKNTGIEPPTKHGEQIDDPF